MVHVEHVVSVTLKMDYVASSQVRQDYGRLLVITEITESVKFSNNSTKFFLLNK